MVLPTQKPSLPPSVSTLSWYWFLEGLYSLHLMNPVVFTTFFASIGVPDTDMNTAVYRVHSYTWNHNILE
jgi:hypothetical protein